MNVKRSAGLMICTRSSGCSRHLIPGVDDLLRVAGSLGVKEYWMVLGDDICRMRGLKVPAALLVPHRPRSDRGKFLPWGNLGLVQ